jgi:hypothetical protein
LALHAPLPEPSHACGGTVEDSVIVFSAARARLAIANATVTVFYERPKTGETAVLFDCKPSKPRIKAIRVVEPM